ncbi:TaqI-like C-terminal specificity domain-containing protein [Weissella confusa]
MSVYIRQNAVSIVFKTGEPWTILSQIEQSIKSKIERYGTPLKEWNIDIQYGVKTGLNEAFIIPLNVKNKLISEDPKSAEIIRPILRGRDIFRDEIHFENIFLINTHNGYTDSEGNIVPRIDIDDYPAIKNWLDNGSWNSSPSKGNNYERLKKRTDQGDTPYNLRSLAYMDDFFKPKVFYREISEQMNSVYTEENIFINNKAYIITGKDVTPSLASFLNSQLFTKIILSGANSTGGKGPKFLLNARVPNIIRDSNSVTEQEIVEYYNFAARELQYLNDLFQ